ncbi:hypothetical protein BC351_10370 [Paenibacillus ferrarius]|uniref:Uncharacterized protein n=1 Tax=Paenibacillus ferrarius TaxID=1469647 RepID=A0A1V4HA02_9BACL|nr:hypothetical protein [Paenibacillus ferrarius]OPH47587.1 hypothetical protein BC351_10370 [Paenibacillus ferrarius]
MENQLNSLTHELAIIDMELSGTHSDYIASLLKGHRVAVTSQIEHINYMNSDELETLYREYYSEDNAYVEPTWFPVYFDRSLSDQGLYPFMLGYDGFYEVNKELAKIEEITEWIGYVGEQAIIRDTILRCVNGYYKWEEIETTDECGEEDYNGKYVMVFI